MLLKVLTLAAAILVVQADTGGQVNQIDDETLETLQKKYNLKKDLVMDDSEKEHLKEHLTEETDMDVDMMSDRELSFHYFRSHDVDHNGQMDGLEMLKAIEHTSLHRIGANVVDEHFDLNTEAGVHKWKLIYNNFITWIDSVFEESDLNDDGYLSYPEFADSSQLVDFVSKESHA